MGLKDLLNDLRKFYRQYRAIRDRELAEKRFWGSRDDDVVSEYFSHPQNVEFYGYSVPMSYETRNRIVLADVKSYCLEEE